jgi:hypothetical protein
MDETGGTARGMTFTGDDAIHVDGGRFIECRFEGSVLIYSGGRPPEFENCMIGDTRWRFEGPALRTIQLLQAIGNSDRGKYFIEDLFEKGKLLTE